MKAPLPAGTMAGTPQVLLAHHLKQLKLPTFLHEYEKVARECAREGVDHPRYLLRLAELELLERERRVTERRIREARFPAVKMVWGERRGHATFGAVEQSDGVPHAAIE